MYFLKDIRGKAKWLYEVDNLPSFFRALLSDASLCMLIYRSMAWCNRFMLGKPFAFLLCKVNAVICGSVIGLGAQFGEEFIILHSVGITINSRVRGGHHIVIENGVVIGAEKRKSPVLGDNIFVGSGAKILGDISIGDNVTIGANAVVVKDVPSNVVVGGVPAKIIRKKNMAEGA